MQFLNPLLLWGLTAAAVPIVIHLLNRRRYRRQRWAAMEWLLAAVKKHQRKLRLESLLLLLLRTLAVLLLALALARPFLSGAPAAVAATQQTHLVLVMDNSASMGARSGLRTTFDEAVSTATSLVGELGSDAPVTLVVSNDNLSLHRPTGRPRLLLRESRDHDKVRQLLGELRPAPARADLVETLKIVDESLPDAAPIRRKIAVVTDRQRATVDRSAGASTDSEGAAIDQVAALLQRLNEKSAEVLLMSVGRPSGNVAVVSVRPESDRDVLLGAPTPFVAEVVNYSDTPQRVELRFLVDGEERGDSVAWLDLPPRPAGLARPAARSHRFVITFGKDEIGPHSVEARIPADAFPLDDVRSYAFEVRPQIRVLVVDGDPNPTDETAARETWTLGPALALRDEGPIEVLVVHDSDYRRAESLEEWDMVILANVRRPAPDAATRDKLEAFVRKGGALLLTVGDLTDPATWNDELWRGGDGPLPVPLVEARVREKAWLQFDLSENRHPILREITHPANSALFQSPLVRGYMVVEDPDVATGARTILKFTDLPPSPALIERRYGRGRTLLLTTTVDDLWGDLSTSMLFVPLLHETVYAVTSKGDDGLNLLTFQTFSRDFPSNLERFELTYPDGTPARADVETPVDSPSYVVFRGTDRTGVYGTTTHFKPSDILSAPPPPTTGAFAVALTPLESDLARIPNAEARARWEGLARVADDLGVAAESVRSGEGEISRALLIAALLCLLAEVALARHIGLQRQSR